jgi:hypothetical protein
MCPAHQVLVVIVRDPEGGRKTTTYSPPDLSATPAWVAETYAGRWSIEDTFRDTKQFLGREDPQCWKGKGPERAAALSFWTYGAVWTWYLAVVGTNKSWPDLPWYPSKCTPSFADALACLRRALWHSRIFATSNRRCSKRKSPTLSSTSSPGQRRRGSTATGFLANCESPQLGRSLYA